MLIHAHYVNQVLSKIKALLSYDELTMKIEVAFSSIRNLKTHIPTHTIKKEILILFDEQKQSNAKALDTNWLCCN